MISEKKFWKILEIKRVQDEFLHFEPFLFCSIIGLLQQIYKRNAARSKFNNYLNFKVTKVTTTNKIPIIQKRVTNFAS